MTEAALVFCIGTGIKRVIKQKHITRLELSNRTGIRPEQNRCINVLKLNEEAEQFLKESN